VPVACFPPVERLRLPHHPSHNLLPYKEGQGPALPVVRLSSFPRIRLLACGGAYQFASYDGVRALAGVLPKGSNRSSRWAGFRRNWEAVRWLMLTRIIPDTTVFDFNCRRNDEKQLGPSLTDKLACQEVAVVVKERASTEQTISVVSSSLKPSIRFKVSTQIPVPCS